MDNVENAVIGALLTDPSVINDVELVPADFEIETYRLIYQTIIDMVANGNTIDVLTVSDSMDRVYPNDDNHWLSTCGRLFKDCHTTRLINAHSEIMRQASRARTAKTIAAGILAEIDTAPNAVDLIDTAVQGLMQLSISRKSYEKSITQAIKGAIEMIEDANENQGTVGVPTGLVDLDKVLSGFHDSDLYIVAARPAMGKTAVLLNFVDNANESIGLISAEQPHEQIGMRMLAINGKVNAHKMRNGTLDEMDYKRVTVSSVSMHEKQDIWINDKSGISILEVIRQARKWKQQHKIKALYVDYVQRIKWTDQNQPRWEQVGNVVMALKELARELQIPVIALAQVNRNVESRPDQRPHMGDIANSSEIEKEADCIMTLYRDEVYDQNTADKGIIEINVLKNRHGPTGFVKFIWDERYMKVSDMSNYQDYKSAAS